MSKSQNCCGGEQFETRRVKYIYSREGQYLFVPDMPAEVCLTCGMIYYDGQALLRVEKRFKAIHDGQDKPDRYANLPVMDYA